MDDSVVIFAQVAFVSVTSVAVLATVGVVSYLRIKRSRSGAEMRAQSIDPARFQRMEDAIETIAIEVERISESQRFLSKLLSEQDKTLESSRRLP